MIYHNDNIPSLWGIFVAKLRYTRKHVSWCYSWMLVRYSSIKRCKANSVDLPRPGWMVGCAVLRPEFHPWSSHKTQMQPWRKTSRHITNPHACWKTNRKTLAQRPRGFEHRDSRPGETFPACLAKSGQVSMVITLNKVYMDCLGAVRITYPSRRSSADPTLEKTQGELRWRSLWWCSKHGYYCWNNQKQKWVEFFYWHN